MLDQTKRYLKKIFLHVREWKKSQDTAGIPFLGAGFNNLTKLHHQRKVQTIRKLKSKSDWIKREKNVLEKTENKW